MSSTMPQKDPTITTHTKSTQRQTNNQPTKESTNNDDDDENNHTHTQSDPKHQKPLPHSFLPSPLPCFVVPAPPPPLHLLHPSFTLSRQQSCVLIDNDVVEQTHSHRPVGDGMWVVVCLAAKQQTQLGSHHAAASQTAIHDPSCDDPAAAGVR